MLVEDAIVWIDGATNVTGADKAIVQLVKVAPNVPLYLSTFTVRLPLPELYAVTCPCNQFPTVLVINTYIPTTKLFPVCVVNVLAPMPSVLDVTEVPCVVAEFNALAAEAAALTADVFAFDADVAA